MSRGVLPRTRVSGWAAKVTTPVLQNTGAQTVSATVTDQRGRTSSAATASYTVLAYQQPYVSSLVIERCDNDGTANEEGHYMGISFTGMVTALNNHNSAAWAVRYREAGTVNWTTVTISAIAGNYTPTHQEIIAAADAKAFDVELLITDDFGQVIAGSGQIPVAYAIMNWRAQGDGMAIGGINTQTGLQIYMDTEITGDVDFRGTLSENGTALFPLSLANGGTGGITAYSNSMTSSSESADIKTWTATVSGSGYVFARVACVCDTTNSWGTWNAEVTLNNVIRAKNLNRFGSNQQLAFSATASDFMQVSNGDTIKLTGGATKSGTKTISYSIVAFGCTVSVA